MKKSRFLNIIKGNSEYLLHNTLYGTMVKAKCDITREIADNLDTVEYDEGNEFHKALKDLRMLVDENVNESSLLNYHFAELNRSNLLVILIVTRQCNFRCTYCYEKHENKKMDREIYENLKNAIAAEIDYKGYKSVTLSFFGGEPMLEYDEIVNFMEELQKIGKEKNVHIDGSMTTNGYDLTIDKFTKLVNLNVYDFQITIDGFRETHDKNRFLVGGGGTWQRIIDNLKAAKASDLNFRITLRANIDNAAALTVREFLGFLSENFVAIAADAAAENSENFNISDTENSDTVQSDSRFLVHFEAVKKMGGELDDKLDVCNDEGGLITDVIDFAAELDLPAINYSPAPFANMCYASKTNTMVLDTNGTIMKCTVAIDSPHNEVGKLTAEGFDIDDATICNWTSSPLPKECGECPILAICYGKKCPMATWQGELRKPEDCQKHIRIYESFMCNSCKVV
ncbi:MAG: radical SAM protein [Turicibacter sp.]|nr:radical SAM protein [Turicibacter sp.]